MNPVIYISVELKARDLDPRLLVAAEALKQGLHVVFGQQWVLSKNIFAVPEGAYLLKTVNEIQATQMLDAREAGHIVCATDEEVLACGNKTCFEAGMGPTAAENLDLFFPQSNDHAALVTDQHPAVSDAIHVTGNPRIDLLSSWGRSIYAKEADTIRGHYGRYVLFNTNYGTINSIWKAREDASEIAIRTGRLDPEDSASVAAYEELRAWERHNMAAMEQIIDWLAAERSDVAVVVRPHPAEDASYWVKRYESTDRVAVKAGTGHVSWTMAAEVLVHTTCSTGMEAALLGTPALSVTPHPQGAHHDYNISNKVNPSLKTADQACAALADFLDTESGPIAEISGYSHALERAFPNLGKGVSAKDMVTTIKSRMGSVSDGSSYSWDLRPGQTWTSVERRAEWQEKFSVDAEEVAARLQLMGGLVGLNSPINLQRIDDSLFHIFPTVN